jgi:hypothetical protein
MARAFLMCSFNRYQQEYQQPFEFWAPVGVAPVLWEKLMFPGGG